MTLPSRAQTWDATRDSARWVGRSAIQIARVVFALLLVFLADRVVAGDVTTDEALAVAGLSLAALAALALTPALGRSLVKRVSKISIGPVALEVFEEAERTPAAKTAEDLDNAEQRVESVLALRLKIERKLTYIAKHVLDEGGHPTFLTIGSLRYDKLLPKKEADLVNQLMTLRDEDIAELSPAERVKFFTATDKIARSIRASVLHCLVNKILRELGKKGWKIRKVKRKNARDDFVAEKDGKKYRIASVFATDRKSDLLAVAKKRLAPDAKGLGGYERRIIVLPHHSKSGTEAGGDPAVVTTDELIGELCRT
jgi:hypothetical protein